MLYKINKKENKIITWIHKKVIWEAPESTMWKEL